ncbi:MAG: hypothetical protein A3B86_02850 [Candidatus Yanofskybacteria bacterium RIFCSPHIGHO2_02_FULL_38_22b]|uniref:DUF6036 domain-containing protein n=1 Tax=Candidatus Yanofskybacteria bacterium RIFCSPHIGHO2_02_FULL_38_22b TaxID=1802673 RepID=A0A1F8F0Z0_9BACT|nr:MAG: hypothetical protein A2816_02440 [Candidatus Yanofskybacteria bacterium RIFCSPHIGHO2_01_FULL_39_44]OGN06811.1 MAG: hypothetical protein A3B86_02850 [Candidatus Yanofskybacteria bacterium RIFCSPHIGHO2_02_FULL_38_22b]OGN20706.1 MAG: hypothetical protein A2910_00810 [Candidatus Yanofskybacteria bacterium RIFCSPLOWO2_01_FULL_39_28]
MKIVNPEKLLIQVVSILDQLKIEYFITGGLARAVWGTPRSTSDIDVVIKILESQVSLLAKALRKISRLGYIDEDTAKEAIRNKGEFNFIDPDSGLKVDFWVAKNNEKSLSEFRRRVLKNIEGVKIYFISPEDLILNKLEWHNQGGSAVQLEDVRSILKSSGKKLNFNYLKKQAIKLEVDDLLEELLQPLTG